VDQNDGMGVGKTETGVTLLCVSMRSDLKIERKEDEVYELQFGQFQQRY